MKVEAKATNASLRSMSRQRGRLTRTPRVLQRRSFARAAKTSKVSVSEVLKRVHENCTECLESS